MAMASDAPHKNAILIACFQRGVMASTALRGQFETVFLFHMEHPDMVWFKKTFLGSIPKEVCDYVIAKGLRKEHDYVMIDFTTFPQMTIWKGEEIIFPTEETGIYLSQV